MAADWDDLKLFLQVAEQGGLSGAATMTGISAPTIGRRMLTLERQLGRSLFQRSQQGYRLAHDGNVLVEHVRSMQKVADNISDWHKEAFALPIVSIAGDAWTSGFIADHAGELRHVDDRFRYCCKTLDAAPDLTFRGVDVAILAEPPLMGNLAVQRSVKVSYSAYRAASISAHAAEHWVSIGTEMARSPADRWVFENHEQQIHTWTGGPDLLHRLVRRGAGMGILPVHVGDQDDLLMRHGDVIAELDHPLFIVANDDDRHRPEVRLVIDRLSSLFRRHEKAFAGKR